MNNDLKNPIQDGIPTWLYKRGQSEKYRMEKKSDGTFELVNSNDRPFSYHLFLLSEIRKAIADNKVNKYHFAFLRNILEKTATFLGYLHWEDFLEKINTSSVDQFIIRMLNLSSHSAHAGDEISTIEEKHKNDLEALVDNLMDICSFNRQETQ